ncbi:uncharacterized protein LOC134227456 [Armigeres subalbatus]|uniref:uncharacterized protein LOC134227456 n=1 Tax=Armigeres subalbatus TaxID=124917 RepID=UPI002ED588A1
MLNAVAVPTLACYDKSPVYDPPTTTIGSAGKKRPLCITQNATEQIGSSEQGDVPTMASALIIEPVEPIEALEDENTIYYIEEEAIQTDSGDVESNNDDQESRVSGPVVEVSDSKRVRWEIQIQNVSEDASKELTSEPLVTVETVGTSTPRVEYQHSSVQTDDVEIVSSEDQLQRRMVEQFYPEYADCSRLDLAMRLKERDERLAELTKKLSSFETAHAAMVKSMEAFKTLVD